MDVCGVTPKSLYASCSSITWAGRALCRERFEALAIKVFCTSAQSRRSKKADDSEANSAVSAEEILDPEVGKFKQQNAADKLKPEVEPKLVKEEKKLSPKKRSEKKAVENTDTKDKKDNEENSNQKRKGWWSLEG